MEMGCIQFYEFVKEKESSSGGGCWAEGLFLFVLSKKT